MFRMLPKTKRAVLPFCLHALSINNNPGITWCSCVSNVLFLYTFYVFGIFHFFPILLYSFSLFAMTLLHAGLRTHLTMILSTSRKYLVLNASGNVNLWYFWSFNSWEIWQPEMYCNCYDLCFLASFINFYIKYLFFFFLVSFITLTVLSRCRILPSFSDLLVAVMITTASQFRNKMVSIQILKLY